MLKFFVTLSIICGIFFISNTNGFFLQSKEKCDVSVYKGGKDYSGEKIMASKAFAPHLKTIGSVAKSCKVKVHVTGSYKQLKSPTEFVLSSQLPLATGHAIQFNLQGPKGETVCNQLCMTARSWKTLPEAKCFIDGVQKKGITFTEPNTLTDGAVAKLSSTDATKLKEKVQGLCAPKTKTPKG